MPRRSLPALLAFALATWGPLAAQTATRDDRGRWPEDTFRDAGARRLVLRALELRDSAAAGLASYEATATERAHIGIAITRRFPGRTRTLYHREELARVYWQRGGDNRLRWLGRREGSPAQGDDWARNAPFGIDFDLAHELDLDDIGVDLLFDPLGDRMDVFDADFVQPVSATGLELYRFASGDTMRIVLPDTRRITLVEVVVEARQTAWEAVEGSLWFEAETGVLVRAAFRPSDVWDQEVREPRSLEDVPGFIKPGIGTIHSIVIEYALFEQRWWLPRRVLGTGEYDWGHGLVIMPITIEWTMNGHVLNEQPGEMVTPGPDLVESGRRFGPRGTMYLTPRNQDLGAAPELPPPLGLAEYSVFSPDELGPLVSRIQRVAGPPPSGPAPSLERVLISSIRFDRVSGLSAAWSAGIWLGSFRIDPSVRLATAVPDLWTGLTIRHGAFDFGAYHRLDDASDWNVAGGIGNSIATLVFGNDGGDYYRVDGASLGWRRDGGVRARIEIFAERQRSIARQTNVSLASMGGGSLRPNFTADRVDVAGLRGSVDGQFGLDVQKTVLNWRVAGEVGTGDARYGRGLTDVRLTTSIGSSSAAAVRLSAGLAGRGSPVQQFFRLGGAATLRGVPENRVSGPAFWMVRTEYGRGLPGLRALVFLDAGWAGPAADFARSRPTAGTGAGVSFLDGLLRMDIARGIVRSNTWRAYFYIDAIL